MFSYQSLVAGANILEMIIKPMDLCYRYYKKITNFLIRIMLKLKEVQIENNSSTIKQDYLINVPVKRR